MFAEFPKHSKQKVSLFIGRSAFKFRVFYHGYMVLLLTFWDTCRAPILWASAPTGTRREFGKAILVK